ncbi:unnamed protein product [Meganyctiphanes norvegica]|uniref:Peptidase S1 domain-containing protein n=1 Tax=Meganyctiphanes norvegica TaxID=48144 RepID=A0AAV2QRD3_MEGNR
MSDSSNHFFIGGGSLIHPQVVLSAAHLPYDNMANDSLIVRLGEWNFQKNNEPTPHQDIKVKQVIYHPRFDRGQMENNYVLLILEHRAVLGETVRTICLPPSNAGEIFNDQLCYLTGWGKSVFSDQAKYQRIMKLLRMRIVEHSKCETALKNTHLGNNFTLHKSNICAGDQGIDACTGDGGSPLVCRDPTSTGNYVQVGVTSYGIGCGTHGLPGVYAAVAPAIDWINENLDKLPDQEKIATSSRLPDSTSEILSGPTTKKPLAVDPRISFNN